MLIVSVEVPEPATDVGLRDRPNPVGALEAVSATVPLKPPSDVTWIELVPDDPWVTGTVVGLAVSVKSWTLTVTIAV